MQPAEFGVGKYLGKIWVNGIPSADNIFGDIAAGKILFPSKTGTSLDFCGRVSDNTISGNYDMLNFLWFVGTEHLYSNTTGKFNLSYFDILRGKKKFKEKFLFLLFFR